MGAGNDKETYSDGSYDFKEIRIDLIAYQHEAGEGEDDVFLI